MLTALLPDTWRALRSRFARRLETLIVEDVLNGHVDPTGKVSPRSRRGNLGTYAPSLLRYFAKRYDLLDNILTLLQKNVYTQNYIGKYLLPILPELVEGTDFVDETIRAIKRAVNDGAILVIDNLKHLPEEWRTKIQPERT